MSSFNSLFVVSTSKTVPSKCSFLCALKFRVCFNYLLLLLTLLTAFNRTFALRLSFSSNDNYGKVSRKFHTCMLRINKAHCQSHFTKVVKDSSPLKPVEISLFIKLNA